MAANSGPSFWFVGSAAVVAFSLFFLAVAFPPAGSASSAPAATSTDWVAGGGLVTVSGIQNVTGAAYWETYCPSPYVQESCAVPLGVAYVPDSNAVILTETQAYPTGSGGSDAIVEFNPVTLEALAPILLPCAPEVPFYSGNGPYVLVPCLNSTTYASGTLLVFDVEKGSIVANASMPFRVASMAYDPIDKKVYAAAFGNAVATIDPTNGTFLDVRNFTDLAFSVSFPLFAASDQLVFDSATGDLVAPSTSGGLVGIDPASGTTQATVGLPSPPQSLAFDPATDQLFVSTLSPSAVTVLNGTTFEPEARLAVPECVDNVCAEPNGVFQVLLDPVHGDAYLLSYVAMLTLNLSSLSVVSTVFGVGDGPPTSAAYIPVADRIFGTYGTDPSIGPGFVMQLTHRTYPAVTTLLWLPTNLGSLLLSALVGSAIALVGLRSLRKAAVRATPPPRFENPPA